MEENCFIDCISENIQFHKKLKRMKVVALVIFFQKGSTRFFHEIDVLRVKFQPPLRCQFSTFRPGEGIKSATAVAGLGIKKIVSDLTVTF